MKPSRLFALVCVIALSLMRAAAQEAPHLLFEVSVDGTTIAKPELRVPLGGVGRLSLDSLQLRFTPTLRGEDLALAFTIMLEGQESRPTLRISRSMPGTIDLKPKADGPSHRIRIVWLER